MSVLDEKSWFWKKACSKGHIYDPRHGPCSYCEAEKEKEKNKKTRS